MSSPETPRRPMKSTASASSSNAAELALLKERDESARRGNVVSWEEVNRGMSRIIEEARRKKREQA